MPKCLTANQLKIIAITAMFFDHFATIFLSYDTPLGIAMKTVGRIVAPTMCYFIAEGYYYTSNLRRYIFRLLCFAVISHIPYVLAFGYDFFQATSVMWPLAMGLIALSGLKSEKIPTIVKPVIVWICCFISLTADWNYVVVLWIVVFGIFSGNFKFQMVGFGLVGIIFHLIPTFLRFGVAHGTTPHWFELGIVLAIPLLYMYNGKLGRKSKLMTWSFYLFYPAHLLLFYLLERFSDFGRLFERFI